MKKFSFVTNLDKDKDLVFTKRLIEWAEGRNCEIVASIAFKPNEGIEEANTDEIYKNSDCVVVLGGDGTILTVAKRTCIYDTPILGINLGTLGYLADVEKHEAYTAMEKVISNNYRIEKRMMLEAFINGEKIENNKGLALNDVCLNNGICSRMIKIEVEVNNDFIDSYRADGIIVSTPTGSTAYNLSAGGPILKPDTELITITNVCPHTLYIRPYVVSGNDEIKIVVEGYDDNVILSLDGRKSFIIENGSIVSVKKSSYYTKIIKTTDMSFYDILRRKMVEVRK